MSKNPAETTEISASARKLLESAVGNSDRVAEPAKMPPAALRAMVSRLEAKGLVTTTTLPGWPTTIRVTDAGFAAIGLPAPSGGAETEKPAPTRRTSLREAAEAFLRAWEGQENPTTIEQAVEVLRAATRGKPRAERPAGEPRKPREGTKQEAVLALLRRPEGASGPQIQEATSWAPHTIRGFLSTAPKRLGVTISAERVRAEGGAKGSYTVYRIPAEQAAA